jgi:hypothetical protein
MNRRSAWLWLISSAALVVVALVLRFGVGSFAPLGTRELFRDEGASWLLSQYQLGDLLKRGAGESYPPLYAIVLKGWMVVLGDSEWAMRALSAAAGFGIFMIAWRWAHEALGRYAGAVAGVLVAISPMALANSRDTRMYALETVFAVAAWFIIWRLLTAREWTRRRRVIYSAVLAIAVGGEVWTLALGLILAGIQLSLCLVAAVVLRSRLSRLLEASAAGVRWASAACVLGLVFFVPWATTMLSVAGNGKPFWTPKPDVPALGSTLASTILGSPYLPVDSRLDPISPWATDAVLLLVVVAVVVAVVTMVGRPRSPGERTAGIVLVCGAAFVPAVWAVSQVRPVYDTRYLLPGLVPMLLLAAAGIARTADWLGRIPRRLSTRTPSGIPAHVAGIAFRAVIVAALALPMALADVSWLSGWTANLGVAPTRAIVDRLTMEVQPGDVVLAVDARSYFSTAYYAARLGEAGHALPCPVLAWDSGVQPFFYGQSLIDPTLTVAASDARARGLRNVLPGLGPNGRIWLVAAANGRNQKVGFDPMDKGVVRETDRQILTQPSGDAAQIILLAFPAT